MVLAHMAQEPLKCCIGGHDVSQIDEVVDMLELAAEMAWSDSCVGLPHILLTDALMCRYKHKHDKADIDRCIIVAERTLLGFKDFQFRSKLASLYDMRYRDFRDRADLDQTIEMAGDAIRDGKLQKSPTQLYQCYLHHGNRLMQRFIVGGSPGDLDLSVQTFEQAVRDATAGSLANTEIMACLSLSLSIQFQRTRNISTINRAIVVAEEAVRISVANNTEHSMNSSILATGMAQRAWETRQMQHINDAISLIETVKNDLPDSITGKYLGYIFAVRYAVFGSIEDYDRAIQELFVAQEFEPLDILEQRLMERYIKLGSKSDLDRYITVLKGKLAASKSRSLGSTAPLHFELGLESRMTVDDHLSSLTRAIEVGKHALGATPLGHPDRTELSAKLAVWLIRRSQYTGQSSDIDEAFILCSPFGSGRTGYSTNEIIAYAEILDARFKRNGDVSGIDLTIQTLQEIARKVRPSKSSLATISLAEEPSRSAAWVGDVDNTSEESSRRDATILASLANLQNCRYLALGYIADLNCAIENLGLAVVSEHIALDTSIGSVARSMYFNLSVFTMTRYNRYHASEDFRMSMHWCNKALQRTAEGDPSRSDMLGVRSNLLWDCFNRSNDIKDLNSAIADVKLASEMSRNPQQQASHLASLGIYLRRRQAGGGDVRDLDGSIRSTQEALAMLDKPWSGKSRHVGLHGLRSLCSALMQRAKLSDAARCILDLNGAVDAIEDAAKNLMIDDPLGVHVYWDLGRAYLARVEWRARGSPNDDYNEIRADRILAVDAFDKCVRSSIVQAPMQINAALEAVPLLRFLGRGRECVDLLKHAFSKLSPLAPRFLPRSDQESNLARDKPGSAAEAAAVLVEEGAHPQEALALLDSGRGILANRAMQVRADTSMLDASIASKFNSLLEVLNSSEKANMFQRDSELKGRARAWKQIEEDAAKEGRKLPFTLFSERELHWAIHNDLYDRFRAEEDLEALVRQIRSDPRTANFLGPPTIEQVLQVLGDDTLVIINDCEPYHTFIINRHFGMRVIKLNLKAKDVRIWSADLRKNRPFLDPTILHWLWTNISDPIIQEMNLDQSTSSKESGCALPRIVWMPIGNLSHFPLHAAGVHGQPSKTVMDRAVSSYTSSLAAFVLGRSESEPSFQGSISGKALLVGMDTTDCVEPNDTAELVPLPFAKEEVRRVGQFCSSLRLEAMEMAKQYRSEILINLDKCTLFHFAGHGVSRPEDPSSSGLAMKDELLTISLLQSDRSMTLLRLRQSDGALSQQKQFLAYLSACLTGALDTPQLLDEGINIISGFQLAGFRHVIGTMWQVSDEYCVKVAEMFYKSLAAKGLSDSAVSLALHEALIAGRDAWIKAESEQEVVFVRDALGEATEENEGGSGVKHSANGQREMTLERRKRGAPSRKLVRAWWVPYVHFGP